jgi:3-oxoacyl-[acyl-carrier-protein] synthase-3/clorobiocin biosynthesis protein CloN2
VQTLDTFIKGVGVFLPAQVTVESAVRQGLHPAEAAAAHQLTGATVAGDLPSPEMALRASQDALKRSGLAPGEIDLLLYLDTWHQGPDGWQPQSYLQRHLVGGYALAVEVRQGCNGVFAALELAADIMAAGTGKETALIVASDNYGTPLLDRWNVGAGFISGDAASAVVLSREPGFAQLLSVRSVAVPEAEGMHRGDEPMFPPGPTIGRPLNFGSRGEEFRREAMAQGIGAAPMMQVQATMMEVVQRTLVEAGIGLADVTRVAFNNFSREMVELRAMAPLGFPLSKSTWDFGRTIGHLGASDQIVSLDYLVSTNQLRPDDHLLLMGVGPGVTLSAAVIKILEPPSWGG